MAIGTRRMPVVQENGRLVHVVQVGSRWQQVSFLGELGIDVRDGLLEVGPSTVADHARLSLPIHASGRRVWGAKQSPGGIRVVGTMAGEASKLRNCGVFTQLCRWVHDIRRSCMNA